MKTNIATARQNMVEQQIRTWNVLDQRVLDLIAASPRDEYVPASYRELAYADLFIPLAPGRTMLTPKLEARLLQELNIGSSDIILEIGTGCGYLTSLLAALGKHVYGVDIDADMLDIARENLNQHKVLNAALEQGDAINGWSQHAPYDVIVVTGSLKYIPDDLKQQLNIGGRMFIVVGESPAMEAVLVQRIGEYNWRETGLFETDLPPLAGQQPKDEFVF